MGSSTLYPLLETFPDAPSALSRAREVLHTLGDGGGYPWPRLSPVTTAVQLDHAIARFPRARISGGKDSPHTADLLATFTRLGIPFRVEEPSYRLLVDLELRPELADLWPLPGDMVLSLGATEPFGNEDSTDEDDATESELDAMVAVLGPLTLNVRWDCAFRGLPVRKYSGVQLCLNSEWRQQYAAPSPGSFGVHLSIGGGPANYEALEAWIPTTGLGLGRPLGGW
jgi:hypothetical protein